MPRSLLNLSPHLRPLFFCGYLLAQLTLLFRAQKSPDFLFGFQMFNASSQFKISLFRQVRRRGRSQLIPVRDGMWVVKDRSGVRHTYRWQDRIRNGNLTNLDQFVHAAYGLKAQLFRLEFAVRDFAQHLPGDTETEAVIAEVDTFENGREGEHVRLRAERK